MVVWRDITYIKKYIFLKSISYSLLGLHYILLHQILEISTKDTEVITKQTINQILTNIVVPKINKINNHR